MITLMCIEFGIFVLMVKFCYQNVGFWIKMLETSVFLIEFVSYGLTALMNPGIPNREYYTKNAHKNYEFFKTKSEKGDSMYQKCSKCNIIVHKRMKVSHCSICNVCVMELDHHCPWTGKCIGKYNLFTFYIFVTGILVYIIVTFITFLSFLMNIAESESNSRKNPLGKK